MIFILFMLLENDFGLTSRNVGRAPSDQHHLLTHQYVIILFFKAGNYIIWIIYLLFLQIRIINCPENLLFENIINFLFTFIT